MRKPIIWLDGKLIEAKPSLLESLAPGVLKAEGVFETMRAREGKIPLLAAHLKRMSRGLKVLKLAPPVQVSRIRKHITRLLEVNRLQNACLPGRQARARVMVWQKGGRRHCAIICEPFQAPGARQYSKGFKAMLTGGHRRQTPVPVKSLDYKIFRESLRKARAAGFDEALLLNHKGELVEGSRTNIFLVKDNCLLTPPVASGCLPGVMRQVVLDRARRLKIRCVAKPLQERDLLEADEAFVTNALLGIMPLTRLGQKQIGIGKSGQVTGQLRKQLTKT